MILELLISTIMAQALVEDINSPIFDVISPCQEECRLNEMYKDLTRLRSEFRNVNTKIFQAFLDNPGKDNIKDINIGLFNKADDLHAKIEALQTEYNALFIKLYPDMKELVK